MQGADATNGRDSGDGHDDDDEDDKMYEQTMRRTHTMIGGIECNTTPRWSGGSHALTDFKFRIALTRREMGISCEGIPAAALLAVSWHLCDRLTWICRCCS